MPLRPALVPALCLALSLAGGAAAQDAAQPDAPALELELNRADPAEGACRLTFVVRNGAAADLDALVYEIALFTDAGDVAAITLFDFGAVPAGTPRVRQFDVADADCATLGQVLVNGAERCEGQGIDPGFCTGALVTRSRIDAELAG